MKPSKQWLSISIVSMVHVLLMGVLVIIHEDHTLAFYGFAGWIVAMFASATAYNYIRSNEINDEIKDKLRKQQ